MLNEDGSLLTIGVLALQGSFAEHIAALKKCKVNTREVRLPSDIEGLSGLIIPGGESTAIRTLLQVSGLDKAIIKAKDKGLKFFGTCAGAILLSSKIEGESNYSFGFIGAVVSRNAYGRQLYSFEKEFDIKNIGKFNVIFIRAPKILYVGKDVEILARDGRDIILAENDSCLIATFHPELTGDLRIHKYFINKISKNKNAKK
ncbi:MAG: pyridoxal 5'-phosphate synthase glutaminase subunit PdxT [Candidatus Diapherotrites archaeon CG08_land_8_20_14_0_20_34_12]|nr:MAG: pyridoxal 5'-phosphate synthase glutaminase subunit PdxT [Candidatus Diapherotrites archaeon CG08_land_8_20_14_0_20_34_12]